MIEMLSSPLMQRALIVALLVGFTAPVVGTYLVQRGMALMGDGIGHISLTGVAVGWLAAGSLGLSPNDVLAIPGAIVASLIGAILIEVVRAHGRTGGDVALARVDRRKAIARVGLVAPDVRAALLQAALQGPRDGLVDRMQFSRGEAVGGALRV